MRFWVHRELPEHPLLCSTSFPGATPCGESHTCFSLCGSLPEGSYVSYNVTKWKGSSSAGRGLPGWSSAPGPCLSYVDLVTQCGCSPTLAHWCGFTAGRCEQNILSWLPGAWSPQVPLCHGRVESQESEPYLPCSCVAGKGSDPTVIHIPSADTLWLFVLGKYRVSRTPLNAHRRPVHGFPGWRGSLWEREMQQIP